MKLSLMLGTLSFGALLAAGLASCATAEPVSLAGLSGGAGTSGKGGSGGIAGSGGSSHGGSSNGGSSTGGSSNGGSSAGGSSNGGSSTGGGGNGGSSKGGSGTGGSSKGGSSNGGSGGTSGACSLGTGDATCDDCITSKCNAVCLACENNTDCVDFLDCFGNCASGDTTCEDNCQTKYANGVADALALAGTSGCLGTTCGTACNGGSGGTGGTGGTGGSSGTLPAGCYLKSSPACNPLTNSGCTNGAACDLNPNYVLKCFDPPNTATLGDDCDPTSGPFCEATLHCSSYYVCAKLCCSDSECSGSTSCVAINPQGGTLGDCE